MEKLTTTYRGDVEDLYTFGSISVVHSDGEEVYHKGDSSEISFPRSSAKLIQVLAALDTGIQEKYNFTLEEISQMCASHSGEEVHIRCVEGILDKIGLDATYLKCGPHYPYKEEVAFEMKKEGIEPTDIHNNCSGKHAAMLATALQLGADVETYYQLDHPVQRNILKILAEVCDIDESDIHISVDGCGVPVHALPLKTFAHGMSKFADPSKMPKRLRPYAELIIKAISEHPINTSGSDRIDYLVMRKYPHQVVVKSGANGYFTGVLPEQKKAFAIKIYDGQGVSRNIVLVELLRKLGIISDEDYAEFKKYTPRDVLNHRKEIVGKIVSHV